MFYNYLKLNLLKQKLFSHSLTCVSVSSSEEVALLSMGFLGFFSAGSCLLFIPYLSSLDGSALTLSLGC